MEIYNNDPLIKKELFTEKKSRKEKSAAREKTINSNDDGQRTRPEEIKELQARVQKSLLRSEAIIGGIENFRALADQAGDRQEKERVLQEVITRTVQDNEQVLAEHKQILETYIDHKDPALMDQLVRAEQDNISSYTSYLGKHAVKEQNFISLGSSLGEQDPEALLRAVIRQLKEQGEPQMNLPHSRVLDLLGD